MNMPMPDRGFTFIEQIIVLAISAILMMLAVPNLQTLQSHHRQQVSMNSLFQAAHLARTRAILDNHLIRLCPSLNGLTCVQDFANGSHWIVTNIHAQAKTIYFDMQMDLSKHIIQGKQSRTFVQFRPNGSAAGSNATFILCPIKTNSGATSKLIISNYGRIRQASASEQEISKYCH